MSKFYGKVGYGLTIESTPGVWVNEIIEKEYYGDVVRNVINWQGNGEVNDDLSVSNSISILADAYAYQHFSSIKYVEWGGVKWKVKSVEVLRPRLTLTLGGEWNG